MKKKKPTRKPPKRRSYRIERILLLVLLAFALFVLVKAAWLSEDAYITFRSIDNLASGYGLRWNVAERVQSYTHPLWMLLVTSFFMITREFYLTVILISLGLSLASLWLLVQKLSITPYAAFPALFALLSSKAFVDYACSGLENPLSFFLLALFYYIFFKRKFELSPFLHLCFITALIGLNRLDTVLFCGVPLLYFGYRTKKDCQASWTALWSRVLIGFTPLIAWHVFSTIYYGFPLPNTAYAKLNTGLSTLALVRQGIKYYSDSLSNDTVTLAVIFVSLAFLIWRSRRNVLWAGLGTVAYLLYVLAIGGGFMSGRFFALPLFSACALLAQYDFKRYIGVLAAVACVLIGVAAERPTYLYDTEYRNTERGDAGITDERGFYYEASGFLRLLSAGQREPNHQWVDEGRRVRAMQPGRRKFIIRTNIGYFGYYAGPKAHIIDPDALNDLLLSRTEIPDKENWRIGHFKRDFPPGYVESVTRGRNLLEDPKLRRLYDDLNAIARDEIWSLERFRAILRVNVGSY